jgi:hypothetical protein
MFDIEDRKDLWVHPDPYEADAVMYAAEDAASSLGTLIERLEGLDTMEDFDMGHKADAIIAGWLTDLSKYKSYVEQIAKTARG